MEKRGGVERGREREKRKEEKEGERERGRGWIEKVCWGERDASVGVAHGGHFAS